MTMVRRVREFGLTIAVLVLVLATAAFAQDAAPAKPTPPPPVALAQPDQRYIRTIDDEANRRIVMQGAARTFVHLGKDGKPLGPSVTMCAAVHIADRTFYDHLQSLLDAKDVVLFESVKPAGMGRPEHDMPGVDPQDRRISTTTSRIRMLGIAAKSQKLKTGAFPASVDDLVAALSPKLRPYLASVTKDAWGHDLEFVRTVDPDAPPAADKPDDTTPPKKRVVRDHIEITSLGADGTPGGEGANEDLKLSDQRPIRAAEIPKSDTKGIQSELADAFGLVFQLDAMTHDHANWRNSDLSVDQVQERLSGEPITEVAKPAGADQHPKPDTDAPIVTAKKKSGDENSEALFKMLDGSSLQAGLIRVVLGIVKWIPGMSDMGKVAMMEMLGRADELMNTVPGMEQMLAVIIKDRNAVVMDDLSRIIETEPAIKTVGIIYGGGHMPDLEKRLAAMGYTEQGVQWLDAISMDVPKDEAGAKQMEQIRTMVRKTLDDQVAAAKKKANK